MSAAESKISEILRICHQQEMSKFPHQGSPTDGGGFYSSSSPARYRESNNNNNHAIDHNAAAAAASSPYSNYLARGGGRGVVGQSHLVGQPAMMGAGMVDASSMNNGPPMLPHHHTQMPPPQFGRSIIRNCLAFNSLMLYINSVVRSWHP